MTGRSETPRFTLAEPYAPQLRTALVLTGTGTAGAYHAGVLRALHEAGVKLDVVAGRGIGVVGALFAAIDGAQRLWDEKGYWRAPELRSLYRWRVVARVIVWAIAIAAAIVAIPLTVMVAGLVVFPLDFLLRMVGVGGATGLVDAYLRVAQAAFAPDALPTWLPRLVFLVLTLAAATAVVNGWVGRGRRSRGPVWWRMVPAPLTADGAVSRCWGVLWDLLRGAAQIKQPSPGDLAKRYAEVLADNLGQPGFRELVILAHDLDARSDLVFALVAESRRRDLFRRPTAEAAELRRAEVIDLSGVGRGTILPMRSPPRWPCRWRQSPMPSRSLRMPTGEGKPIACAIDRRVSYVCSTSWSAWAWSRSWSSRLRPNHRVPMRSPHPASMAARDSVNTSNRRKRPRSAMRRGPSRGPPACSRSVPHTTLSVPSTSAAATTIGRIGGSRSTSS